MVPLKVLLPAFVRMSVLPPTMTEEPAAPVRALMETSPPAEAMLNSPLLATSTFELPAILPEPLIESFPPPPIAVAPV
jgi:hypothetical protein